MKEHEQFWNHPLAYWLHDCATGDPPLINELEWRTEDRLKCPIHYNEVLNGFLMTSLMNYIHPLYHQRPSLEMKNDSIRNQYQFQNLLFHIIQYYRNNLEQLVICTLPDIQVLATLQADEKSYEEVRKVILLILGCAIQSDKKKVFVDRITGFDQKIQVELANYIQQFTEGSSIVVSASGTEKTEFFGILEKVMKERDALMDISRDIHDNDSDETNTNSSSNSDVCSKESFSLNRPISPSSTAELRTLSLQLSNASHENRKLRTQAENKDEECRKLEVEMEEKNKRISSLENERLRLLEKERQVTNLGDELQAAQIRIEKLKSLEGYEKRYRTASEELEFFKSKFNSVKESCTAQEEAIAQLERKNMTLEIENKNLESLTDSLSRLRESVSMLEKEVEQKNMEIEDVTEEKYKLNQELKERDERIAQLEMSSATNTPRFLGSLADQLEDAKQDELEMVKAEVRKLRAQTEGATPDTTLILQHSVEIEELRQKLASEEVKSAQLQLKIQEFEVEREKFDGNMERIGIEIEETAVQVEEMRVERDEAIKSLNDARRKFSQFQLEFGKKIEEESENRIRNLNFELDDVKRKLTEYQEGETEIEHQLTRIKEDNRKLLFEVDELTEEKKHLEMSIQQIERSRKSVELEREHLKSKMESLEDTVEDLKLQLLNSGISQKRLDEKDNVIGSLHDEKGDLENELRMSQQQLKIETKKLQRLREDLVSEKSKRADLIGRLRSLCTTLIVNRANVDLDGIDDEQLINSIDDIMMNALVAVKRESDALRIQSNKQIEELRDLKRDIEKLRRCESESLNESDDRVRELTKENIHSKEQVFMLQEKLRELNLELSAKHDEVDIAKSTIEELNRNSTASSSNNAEIARLQVSIRNSQIQEDLVKQENIALRGELQEAQKQNQKKNQNLDELEMMHKTLLKDHSRLQQLHNLLTRDYDEVKQESVEIRQKLQTLPKQQAAFMSSNLRELEGKLAEEISRREQQHRMYKELEKEHSMCRNQIETLRRDVIDTVQSREELKSELRRVSETCLHRSNSIEELKKTLGAKMSEISKMNGKIEALSQLNRTYNEENKNLSRQLEILLNQNKELLTRALHDKDQYHLEMKDFQDQLSALRRHKEKLEDKIMDQYRTMENKKSTPERKQPLVKRAAKALINRRRVTSNGGSTTEDSSVYSADERSSPPLAGLPDDNDNLPPTCSSSDDHERISPNMEDLSPPKPILRLRNDFMGGSVRVSPHTRRFAGNHSLDHDSPTNYSPSYLPPRIPIRNTPTTSSLRSRPPPPPYTPNRNNYRANDTTNESVVSSFEPKSYSTPKKEESPERQVVGEGEKRENVRDKEERIDKTLSYYENVNCSEGQKSNESTIWYEYGCV